SLLYSLSLHDALTIYFGHAGFNGFCHAAQLFNLIDDLPGFPDNICRKRFNIVRTAEGIDDMTDLRFLLNNDLRVAGNLGGKRRRSEEHTSELQSRENL